MWRDRENVDALTIACVEHAEDIAARHEFKVTQGSYQDGQGDENSAGTHDLGGVVDLEDCGHEACLRALRQAGFAAWRRTPAQGPWRPHYHCVVIDHPYLADSASRQVMAYLNRRDGLKVNGPDDGPRLDPIPRPIWPYPPEEDMATYDSLLKGMDKKLDKLIDKANDSARRERYTNALLRKVRGQIKDVATLEEIDALLAGATEEEA